MGSRVRRHVKIGGPPRLEDQPTTRLPVIKVTKKLLSPCVPTGDRRHMLAIREGSISFEVFSKKRLAELPLFHDVERDLKEGRNKEIDNAAEKLREGRKKSAARNGEDLRKRQKSKTSVLRDGKKAGRKRQPDKSRKQSVQETAKKKQARRPQAQKKQVTKKSGKPAHKKYVKRRMTK